MEFPGSSNKAVGRTSIVVVVVVVVIILVAAGVALYRVGPTATPATSSSSSSSSVTGSSATTTQIGSTSPSQTYSSSGTTESSTMSIPPSTSSHSSTFSSTSSTSSTGTVSPDFTYETIGTYQFLDPQISWSEFDATILQNVYDPLIWYNGTNPLQTIPWLAQNYTISRDGTSVNFTLRSGIKFADGEPLNSSAVYFSFNKLLVEDGSTPTSHGSQATFFIGQMLNTTLSSTLCCKQTYNSSYVNEWLAQDFVQITGPLTFTLHIIHPTTSFAYLLSNEWGLIVAPDYVMQKDLATWTAAGYTLPYTTLNGNTISAIGQYLQDEASTCNTGATPNGCAQTYLDNSAQGSLAGTGPYIIANISQASNDIVLKANPNYWGGPYHTRINPYFTTVNINYVPSIATRELDLQDAAASNRAMSVDITSDHLYDVANRTAWLGGGTLQSIIPGVTMYGPYSSFTTDFNAYDMNVTNPETGALYTFQPFSDVRMRLAFSDAVNMSLVNQLVNNNLGKVAINTVPPGIPPQGSYNSSNVPDYSFNLTAVQDLLVSAMENPLTHFTFYNGTAAPAGYFNNTFGCSAEALQANGGTCKNPVGQTIPLVYVTGDTVDQEILSEIANAVNNVSSTYRMGLTVSIVPLPLSVFLTETSLRETYIYAAQYIDDYPYVLDFLSNIYTPGYYEPVSNGWNLTQFTVLYNEALNASTAANIQQLLSVSNEMNTLANKEVMYLWTFYPLCYIVSTSNVQGYNYNPSLSSSRPGLGVAGPEYFAALS